MKIGIEKRISEWSAVLRHGALDSFSNLPGRRLALRCARGFTLIELVLVLTLLGVIASLVAPALGNFIRGRSLDSEARRLLSLTRAGQSRAVSEGMPIMLWIDVEKRRYGLEEETPDSESGDPKAEDLAMDDNVEIEVMNLATTPGKFKNLPAICFLPDGTIEEGSPLTVRLGDSSGANLWLIEMKTRMGYEIRNTEK